MINIEKLTSAALRYPVKIGFKGEMKNYFGYETEKMILVGGAITTEERLIRFTESLAYLMDNGDIMRFGKKIGTIDDIEILDQ